MKTNNVYEDFDAYEDYEENVEQIITGGLPAVILAGLAAGIFSIWLMVRGVIAIFCL